MPRIDMNIFREIQFFKSKGLSKSETARRLKVNRETVTKYWERSGVGPSERPPPQWALSIDWDYIKKESSKGILLTILYQEFSHVEGLPVYENFVRYFRLYHRPEKESAVISPKVDRIPGNTIEIDYSGDRMSILSPSTGEIVQAELFVAAMSFSSHFYAEFTLTQKMPDLLRCCQNAFEFIGKVPTFIVSDNCLTAVTKAEKHDAYLNKNFSDFCHHYGLIADPARVRHPKDKPHVENSIGVIQKEFFQLHRHRTFTSLYELNMELKNYLKKKMDEVIAGRSASRGDLLKIELPKMRDLPLIPFSFFNYKRCKVHPDGHIRHQTNFYSVPYSFVGKEMDIKFNDKLLYIYCNTEMIATHQINLGRSHYVTQAAHHPEKELIESNFYINSLKQKSKKIGPWMEAIVKRLFEIKRNHPLRNLSKIQGIISLEKNFNREALEYAAKAAIDSNRFTYQYIKDCAQNYRPMKNENSTQPIRRQEFVCLRGGLQ